MRWTTITVSVVFCIAANAFAQEVLTLPHNFAPGQKAQASEVNENFQVLIDEINRLRAELAKVKLVSPDDRVVVDANGVHVGTLIADFYEFTPAEYDCLLDPITFDCNRYPNRFLSSINQGGEWYQVTVCNGVVDFGTGETICDATVPYVKSPLLFASQDCSGEPHYDPADAIFTLLLSPFPAGATGNDFYSPIWNYVEMGGGGIPPWVNDSTSYRYQGGPVRVYDTFPVLQNERLATIIDASGTPYITNQPREITPRSKLDRNGVCKTTEVLAYCGDIGTDPTCSCGQFSQDGTYCEAVVPAGPVNTFSLQPAALTLPNITLPVTPVAR